jgi:cobalt-zinc-cadmium efflux system outer membrane protein
MHVSQLGLALFLGGLWLTAGAAAPAVVEAGADASVSRFVQAIAETNPRVQAARAALEASGARRDAASRPLYNPALSLDAEDTDVETTQTIGLSQTIDWADKREARTAVAASGQQVARAEYLGTRWTVMVDLLSGLAGYRSGIARDDLAAERVQLMNEFASLAERRFEAGDLPQVELDVARIAATDARIQKATAAAALAEARQSVRNLAPGSPPGEWPTLGAELPALPPSADPQQLVMALPVVQAVQAQVEVASSVVELRQREKKPDPTFGIVGGKEDGETLVGLNVTIPLYLRNRFSHEVTAALAEETQAEQIASDVMQRAHARLVSATERYQLVRGAWNDWESTGRESLVRQASQLRRMWEAGELSTTDYLVQLRLTLDVRQNVLELQQSLWSAWFEWLDASGQIDAWLGLDPAL